MINKPIITHLPDGDPLGIIVYGYEDWQSTLFVYPKSAERAIFDKKQLKQPAYYWLFDEKRNLLSF